MRSVPPHQRAEKAIHDLLRQGISEETAPDAPPESSVTRLLMRLGLEGLLNRALEDERTDFVGCERYVRTNSPAEEPPHQGCRNDYKSGPVDTTKGRIGLALPWVRQSVRPFQPQPLTAVNG
jgi:transposase-like protein